MKPNGRKLLILLFNQDKNDLIKVPNQLFGYLWGDLTPGGQRSLISWLRKQKLITSDRIGDQTLVRATDAGLNQIKSSIPVFRTPHGTWGHWTAIIFREALKTDKQFRYLRLELLKQGGMALSRGCYIFPGDLPITLLIECQERYAAAVVVVRISDWLVGSYRDLIMETYNVIDLANAYSGISNQLNRLIGKKSQYNELNHQQKIDLCSLFSHFCDLIAEDYGFVSQFYPQVPSALVLLKRFQSLFI